MGDGIVGRRRELDSLQRWLQGAGGGAGRLVLCAGEPGIGKTRLALEVAGIALAGGTAVGWGRCVEAEGAPAFWPWRQVLGSLEVDPDTVFAGHVESPEDRFRVFDDVTEALRGTADKSGLVVILDDIHWPMSGRCSFFATSPTGSPGRGCSSSPPSATLNPRASFSASSPTCRGHRRSSASTCAASTWPRCASSCRGRLGTSRRRRRRRPRRHRRKPVVRQRGRPSGGGRDMGCRPAAAQRARRRRCATRSCLLRLPSVGSGGCRHRA